MANEKRIYSLKQLYEMEKADDSFIKMIINVFLEFVPTNAADLITACKKEDWASVYFLAHKMKANINLLNIEVIKDDIVFIETSAKMFSNLEQLESKAIVVNNVIQQAAKEMKEDFSI